MEKVTQQERDRLNEIMFWDIITYMFGHIDNPMRVYDLVELLCAISNCSFLRLQNTISIIMTNDRRYMPTKRERLWLYQRAGYSVRTICTDVGVSQRDYYNLLHSHDPVEVNTLPRFEPTQDAEIEKFLTGVAHIVPERKY